MGQPASTGSRTTGSTPRPVGHRKGALSQSLLADILADELAAWQQETGTDPVDIADLGGGTGGIATRLAGQGHSVVVVDPSPDALASLQRRAADAGVADRITARLGDAADVVDVVGSEAVDVMVCHRVLEMVDQPVDALRAMATCLRPGGMLSLLVPGRRSAVLAHALNGQFQAARDALTDERRFDPERVSRLLTQAGFEVTAQHGIGALADVIPETVTESTAAREQLYALDREISTDAAFRALAPQLHVTARFRR
ncbi:methyltransferase domain-containing protein [Propionibacteriaceae bacterium Y2011]|uniref:methyltransferase domain-containing protein n=1 Tax=Microlunatus sp. Y2014 TaxID=3418488 RepID=UPI003B49F1C8